MLITLSYEEAKNISKQLLDLILFTDNNQWNIIKKYKDSWIYQDSIKVNKEVSSSFFVKGSFIDIYIGSETQEDHYFLPLGRLTDEEVQIMCKEPPNFDMDFSNLMISINKIPQKL